MKSHGYLECAAPYIELCNLMGAPLEDDSQDSIFNPSPSPTRSPGHDALTDIVDLDASNQELARHTDNMLVSFAEFAARACQGIRAQDYESLQRTSG
jgi:hypothetical protein